MGRVGRRTRNNVKTNQDIYSLTHSSQFTDVTDMAVTTKTSGPR